MGRISRFIARQNSHGLRNAMAGGRIDTFATDGVIRNFGGFGISAVDNNALTVTWVNASSTVTPFVLCQPVDNPTSFSSNATTAAILVRVGGEDANSAVIGVFNLVGTITDKVNVAVFGQIIGNGSTSG